jgi:hypothetical protein
MASLSERKYQLIKLYHSGKLSLSDLKSLFRGIAVASEYMSEGDRTALLELRHKSEKFSSLLQTRALRREAMGKRFKPAKLANREEHIANFLARTSFTVPHGWERYGNLVRRGKRPSKPRPGSSKGKVARTIVRGARETNAELDALIASVQRLTSAKREALRKRLGIVEGIEHSATFPR